VRVSSACATLTKNSSVTTLSKRCAATASGPAYVGVMTEDEQLNSIVSGDEVHAAPEPLSAIGVRNLSKSFGSQGVLDGVSLDIAESEMLVVLGPSGSGHSF
jgi:hypothetical protein